jgi:tRNA (mo5U34)-methyltransferase
VNETPAAPAADFNGADAARRVAEVPIWYHTMELMPGVVTPGQFDLRPVLDMLPWPDVRDRRCLDIGTWDGCLAFELERRGAREVVAVDIPDHESWDWPPRIRARGIEFLNHVAGPRRGDGFRVARELLGSKVHYEEVSAYDLDPSSIGEFDVVVCGSLLLHLRDPLRALAAIRSVCAEAFLCTNQVDLRRSIGRRRSPLVRLDGVSDLCQWFLPNVAGNRQMLLAAGFEIDRESKVYSIPFGAGHAHVLEGPTGSKRVKHAIRRAGRRAFTGRYGVPHHAALARPVY